MYGLWLVYAAGLEYLLMTAILFAPGIVVYLLARRETQRSWFTAVDGVIAAAIVVLAVVSIWLLATGEISPP